MTEARQARRPVMREAATARRRRRPGPDDDIEAPGVALTLPLNQAAPAQRAAALLARQRVVGNQALARAVDQARAGTVQRDPPTTAPASDTAREAQADRLYDDMMGLSLDLARGQQGTLQTRQRGRFLKRLEALAADIGEIDSLSAADLARADKRFRKLADEIASADEAAQDDWVTVLDDYLKERKRLDAEPDQVNEAAIGYLDAYQADAEKRIDQLPDILTQEDVDLVSWPLYEGKHLERAERDVARQLAEMEAVLAELEELKAAAADEPGVVDMIWGVLGWDSLGDFAADMALMAVTGGWSKVVRIGRKAKKVKAGLKAARRASRAADKLAELGKAADEFVALVETVATGAGKQQVDWLRKNWSSIRLKIETDLLAGLAADESWGGGSAAVRRIEKEAIAAIVNEAFPTQEDEETSIKVAVAFLMAGKGKVAASQVGLFLKMNVRRRLATNLIHQAFVAGTHLSAPFSGAVLKGALTATAFETAQDLVTAMPLIEGATAKTAVEAVRKIIQEALT